MRLSILPIALFAVTATAALAQEGLVPTQALIREDSKSAQTLSPDHVTVKVDNHQTSITSLRPVPASGAQVALLIDDGLRSSFGRNFEDIRKFIQTLPPATEILVGYMRNGSVSVAQPFTTDHAAAAKHLRIPMSSPGISASPYFCLSEFVKHWPGASTAANASADTLQPLDTASGSRHKARFVLMITNGVDPYNGSTSVLNQQSPYVETAVRDAQRAGVSVSSIYFGDAGIRGGQASFSGQNYLSQVSEGTGGTAYYQGSFSPVSLAPYLKQFSQAISETYVATFPASGRDLVRFQVSTDLPNVKLRHPEEVHPGTLFTE